MWKNLKAHFFFLVIHMTSNEQTSSNNKNNVHSAITWTVETKNRVCNATIKLKLNIKKWSSSHQFFHLPVFIETNFLLFLFHRKKKNDFSLLRLTLNIQQQQELRITFDFVLRYSDEWTQLDSSWGGRKKKHPIFAWQTSFGGEWQTIRATWITLKKTHFTIMTVICQPIINFIKISRISFSIIVQLLKSFIFRMHMQVLNLFP